MKYVIVETVDCGNCPILFDDSISHDEMAHSVPGLVKIKSAGFIQFIPKGDGFDIRCGGMSVSLGLSSDPEFDTRIVKLILKRNIFQYDDPDIEE